MDKQI